MIWILSKQFLRVVGLLLVFSMVHTVVHGQGANRLVSIDKDGIMHWQDNNQEVALFGVNYCLPSGYSYRAVQYAGADHKKVIDDDMAHLARIGLDAIRLSFWGDWENSDKDGNLVDNIHLDLLDYVIAQASKRGIYMLLTPITLYSPVWPEPEEMNTCQGFPRFYPKRELGINAKAIEVQQKYLADIMNHVNRYTKLAYKDDPAIVFVEPVNEPHHHPDKNPVDYMNALVKAIRDTGYKRPIFFNVSQDMSIAPAIRDSQVDGAAFGWYPSGLVNGYSLQNNFLPRVDEYRPMFDPALKGKPKLVYEFDAADIGGSYLYPAIARTYRSAGIQFAAMFTYDPLAIASNNLEYQTHFLNLLYTPNKAVSLMIAAQAFRSLPGLKSYGKYPADTRFDSVRVSYEENLSEWVTDQHFYYSNTTKTTPPNPDKLERIVGCGTSAVAGYEGTGVYFLEKLDPGVWRLVVYPDAVWVNGPFGKPSRGREVSRLVWRQHKMKITLPDLGPAFALTPIDKDNNVEGKSATGEFIVSPGVYLLTKDGVKSNWTASSPFGAITLGEYRTPSRQSNPVSVLHHPPRQIVEEREFEITAQVVSDQEPKGVSLFYRHLGADAFKEVSMRKAAEYQYTARIPATDIKTGSLDYAISVQTEQETRTFPADVKDGPQQLSVVSPGPVILYEAKSGTDKPRTQQWSVKDALVDIMKTADKTSVLRVKTSGFDANGSVSTEIPLNSNLSLDLKKDYGNQKYEDIVLVIKARSLIPDTTQIQMILTDTYNMQRMLMIPLQPQWREYPIKLKDSCAANLVSARFVFGTWLYPGNESAAHGFEIEKITVQPSATFWQVPVVSEKSDFVLFDAQKDADKLIFPNAEHKVAFTRSSVSGIIPEHLALRVEVPTFAPAPHDVSFRLIYDNEIEPRRTDLGEFNMLRLRARGVTKETDCLAIALIERDGNVRGSKVPLTAEWRDIEIPLNQLSPMTITFLPRPYPTVGFDYWDQGDKTADSPLNLKNLEALQISFGSRLFPKSIDAKHAIEIEDVRLVSKSQ